MMRMYYAEYWDDETELVEYWDDEDVLCRILV